MAVGALALAAVWAAPARAGTIVAAEIGYDNALLSNFNLVALSTVNTASPVGTYTNTEGRVMVGGSINVASGNVYNACAGTASSAGTAGGCGGNMATAVDGSGMKYGALTVFGSVVTASGGYGFTAGYQSAGTAYVAGSANGTFYANGSTAGGGNLNVAGTMSSLTVDRGRTTTTMRALTTAQQTNSVAGVTTNTVMSSAASVFPFASMSKLSAEVKNLAAGIAVLPGTPGVKPQTLGTGTSAFITAQNDYSAAGKKYGVITTTVSELAGKTGGFQIDNNGMDATLVIVKGDCPSCLLPTLNSYAGQNRILFDFVEATALSFAGAWNASILAPLATITSMKGIFDGTIIVNAINQSQAIYATDMFVGDLAGLIPEPTSLTLFGLGAAVAGLVRRRRRSTAA